MTASGAVAGGPSTTSAGRILIRCLGYVRPYWTYSAGAYVLLMANSGITLAQPLIIRNIVDQGIRGGTRTRSSRALSCSWS